MKKPLTNVQLVNNMMMYSEAGAIKQAFILEALRVYALVALAAEPWPEPSMVSQESWKLCAQECLDSLETRNLQS